MQQRYPLHIFIIGVVFYLGMAVMAADLGVSAIIGAFLAGMALAETTEGDHAVYNRTNGVTEFLVPFFLVNVGMQVDLAAESLPPGIDWV
jgi:Kef-type K+ transport system membrane component KefB